MALAAAVLPAVAEACPVCFGAPGSQDSGAQNAAILLLLGVVLAVLGCIGAFALHLARCGARVRTARPTEAAETI